MSEMEKHYAPTEKHNRPTNDTVEDWGSIGNGFKFRRAKLSVNRLISKDGTEV